MATSTKNFPEMGTYAQETFGRKRTGEVVGHNYADGTVTLWFTDWTETEVHVMGIAPCDSPF